MANKLYEQSYTVSGSPDLLLMHIQCQIVNKSFMAWDPKSRHAPWTSNISDIALRVARRLVDPRVAPDGVTKFTNISGSGPTQLTTIFLLFCIAWHILAYTVSCVCDGCDVMVNDSIGGVRLNCLITA